MSNEPQDNEELTPEKKIQTIKESFSIQEKQELVPPVGLKFSMGPFKYKVTFTNPGQLRFTAELVDVPVAGEKKLIIEAPNTIVKPKFMGARKP